MADASVIVAYDLGRKRKEVDSGRGRPKKCGTNGITRNIQGSRKIREERERELEWVIEYEWC